MKLRIFGHKQTPQEAEAEKAEEAKKAYEGHKPKEVTYDGVIHLAAPGNGKSLNANNGEWLHDVLRRAREKGEADIRFADLGGDLGYRVVSIGDFRAAGKMGLAYKVNGGTPKASPGQYLFEPVKPGDLVEWYDPAMVATTSRK